VFPRVGLFEGGGDGEVGKETVFLSNDVACLQVHEPNLGGNFGSNGADPLLCMVVWVVGMDLGWVGWQMDRNVSVVVDGWV
jgi:hypothetical protein